MIKRRRSRRGINRINPGKTGLDGATNELSSRLTARCQREAREMIQGVPTIRELLPQMIDPEIMGTLIAAKGASDLPAYANLSRSYVVRSGDTEPPVSLTVDYEHFPFLPPKVQYINLEHPALRGLAGQYLQVWRRWKEVNDIVDWLDIHASTAAIRYYFPAIMSLIPEYAPLKNATTERFKEPQGIAPWLPRIREASATIAASEFLSKDTPHIISDSIAEFTVSTYARFRMTFKLD